ncbi:hypothetical protein DOTSEDRAFT_18955 [Dothistroma septosporum NZE10]|uniref:Mediator of RNA polymerase II transcription subunit 8 n=1 Tax=Dothistroma septosporum (strain NZE10 / CBS 128990) TaxID=675120 RepID=N1PY14_DOTSN|nr:hypothetical protein DOTSEDRAFT_18955 [Dothistroma septosporum NZE10]
MALPQESQRAIDNLRTRLSMLSNSLGAMQREFNESNPLPTWPRLQSQAVTLGNNLQEIADVLNSQHQLFSTMHAYPVPSFPGTTQEPVLQGLLRKKLDPRAEEWIDEALKEEKVSAIQNGDKGGAQILSMKQMQDLWESAGPTFQEILQPLMEDGILEDEYTIQEREDGIQNVVTGIRRKLYGPLDDDDEDEDEDMEIDEPEEQVIVNQPGFEAGVPYVRLDDLLKFAVTGSQPAPPR